MFLLGSLKSRPPLQRPVADLQLGGNRAARGTGLTRAAVAIGLVNTRTRTNEENESELAIGKHVWTTGFDVILNLKEHLAYWLYCNVAL